MGRNKMTEENSTESELIESVTDADSNIRLREAFELFDADKDGEITLDELQKIMNLHGYDPSQEELQNMIEQVDKNKNGTVDFEEFLIMMESMREAMTGDEEAEDDISQAFKVFDKDGDGLITAEEIQETMLGLGEDVSEADLNGDGFIDFTEFSNLMKNSFGGLHGSTQGLA